MKYEIDFPVNIDLDRPRFKDLIFLEMTQLLGQLGTCDRKAVGAIITRGGRCVSWGFNGAPPGLPHCDENRHGYKEEEQRWFSEPDGPSVERVTKRTELHLERFGCRNATHAEANALAFAARQGISTDGGTLYVTVSPCEVCARLLIAAGIERVVYAEKYRDESGIMLLLEGGVEVG
jgi:dCMP deaminase